MINELYDASLSDPADDLLGVAPSAKILAARLAEMPPPFTVGVYGEWGSGKTSFVSFVDRYLQEIVLHPDGTSAALFIPFSAWPYKSADEVWRALILRIAQKLLGLQDPAEESSPTHPRLGVADYVKGLLAKEVIVIRDQPRVQDVTDQYAELVANLDESLYGGIGKGSHSTRLNTTEASLAIAKGTVAVLASLSPMMSALKRLFGFSTDIDPAKLFDKEQNESTRQRIESMEIFRRMLRALFRDHLDGRRVFVFIDDLDRCMPDSALDLLEAIKIFLTEDAPCTFLVAADETLIGQGLRMRLRDLPESAEDAGAEAFLAQKGREYFEKIVQLPVHLPRPGSREIQRFIGAGFPEWLPASDLIETAVGTNPRRVKQYCSRLQYQRTVLTNNVEATLLDELITIRSKDEVLFESVCALAKNGPFASAMEELERWARDPKMTPQSAEAQELEARIGASRAILRILAQPPEMSKADPQHLLLLAEFADLRPAAGPMFSSKDGIFMRLLEASRQAPPSPAKLIVDDLSRFASMELYFPTVAAKLRDLGEKGKWGSNMAALEAALRGDSVVPLSSELEPIYNEIRQAPVLQDGANAAGLICGNPPFSSMPFDELRAYGRIHPSLPSPDVLIEKKINPHPSSAEKGRALAEVAFNALTSQEHHVIEAAFKVRQEEINRVVGLRAFVKKDALDHCWPHLYDLLRHDTQGLFQIEKQIQSPDISEQDAQLLRPYLEDERLVRLLNLQPYFRDMPELIVVAGGAVSAPVISVPPPTFVAPPAAAVSTMTPGPLELSHVDYEDVHIILSRAPQNKYSVLMKSKNLEVQSDPIELNWDEFRSELSNLRTARDATALRQNRDVFAPRKDDFSIQLKRLGLMVYDLLFQKEVRREFLNLLGSSRNLRLHWEGDLDDPQCALLPWECLYVPPAAVSFLALSRSYSLTRRSSTAIGVARKPIGGSLRILFVSASPRGVPSLPMIEQEVSILQQIAQAAGSKVELVVIEHATRDKVTQTLREFRPHIFHFTGHGVYQSELGGHLVFETEDGEAWLAPAEHIAILLHDYDVFLTVLNGCDTGVSTTNDAVSGVAGSLIKAGVPAVVATMREVYDEQAMLFAREFYRSFFAGFTVEGSIAEARKALSLNYWDWAAYALFVGSVDLNSMRVMTPFRSEKV